MGASGRISALLVHGDGEVLDYLARTFSGFDVVTAVSAFRAQAVLEGDRAFDVVVAPWESPGAEVYRWVLQHRTELRTKFVFVADEVPPEFEALVRGRCLTVPLAPAEEIVRVATVVARRRTPIATPLRGVPILGRPTLLLVEDDPMLLEVMAALLGDAGYAVTQAESGAAAVELLEKQDYDAILCDWRADVYDWIVESKPALAARVVFVSEGESEEAQSLGRPVFRKGQDARELTKVLADIVAKVRSS